MIPLRGSFLTSGDWDATDPVVVETKKRMEMPDTESVGQHHFIICPPVAGACNPISATTYLLKAVHQRHLRR